MITKGELRFLRHAFAFWQNPYDFKYFLTPLVNPVQLYFCLICRIVSLTPTEQVIFSQWNCFRMIIICLLFRVVTIF